MVGDATNGHHCHIHQVERAWIHIILHHGLPSYCQLSPQISSQDMIGLMQSRMTTWVSEFYCSNDLKKTFTCANSGYACTEVEVFMENGVRGRARAHRTVFQDICRRNWTSIPSAAYNQDRSGLYVERIWASSNKLFWRKSCLKNGCFTIKSAPKFQNLEKFWKNISNFFSCLFGI